MEEYDAVVVGSGPNGLSAAIRLSECGFRTCVFEAKSHAGGGLSSLQNDGFIQDECSAIHPMGILSPYFKTLGLEQHGLSWRKSSISVAHPLDDRPAALLSRDFSSVRERLSDRDGKAWEGLFAPFLRDGEGLLRDLMGPLAIPHHPLAALRFGWFAHRSARGLARAKFTGEEAQALFGGLAAHSVLSLEHRMTAAFGLIFGLAAHMVDWPCVEGGSARLAEALVSKLRSLGGELRLASPVQRLADLPRSKVVLFDVAPRSVIDIAGEALPESYVRRLRRYVYGPGTFKLDFTLHGSIPWRDSTVREASTVHVGGSLDEIAASERAAWYGEAPQSPYLIVCQQSELDPLRAPAGKHTGYAYCHVPAGYPHDVSELIVTQIERFAPGFRDAIRTQRATSPSDFERLNPSYVGGAITGGAATFSQLLTRPVARLDPYSTPNPRLFLCGASTPPGGGVHGMCGYHAAQSAVRRLNAGRGSSFLLST